MKYLKENEIAMNQLPLKKENNIMSKINKVTPALQSYSILLMKNEFDANDLYQDTVLSIISKSEKYKMDTNFKAWAMTIMRNIFINNYRRRKRMRAILNEPHNVPVLNLDISTNLNGGESRMAYKELLRMLSKLPENFKRPFWMFYKGYQYKEIAELLGVPLGTIKTRIFFARRTLQTMYKQAG